MTRHRWSERTVISPNKSERQCLRCGMVKASIHQWDGPKELHWPEFYRGLDKIECAGTPPCTSDAKAVSYDARNYTL